MCDGDGGTRVGMIWDKAEGSKAKFRNCVIKFCKLICTIRGCGE
jgi:hypothetical protein